MLVHPHQRSACRRVAEALENRHVNVDRRAKPGALTIVPSSDAYAIRGDFDPERTVGIFSDAIEAALRDGLPAFARRPTCRGR